MRSIFPFVLVLVCFLFVSAWSPARADGPMGLPTKPEARAHLKEGNRFYKRAHWSDALREYQAGIAIEDIPLFDYNMGQALRMSGAYEDSLLHYERFLDRGQPDGVVLSAVQGFIAEMRAQLANRARTMPPTEPATAPDADARLPAPRAATAPATPENELHRLAAPSPKAEPWYKDGLGWGVAAVGLTAVAGGALLTLNASSLSNDANASSSQDRYRELHDKADSRLILGASIGIGGVALLATGIIKLAIHSDGPVRVASWGSNASGRGLALVGTF